MWPPGFNPQHTHPPKIKWTTVKIEQSSIGLMVQMTKFPMDCDSKGKKKNLYCVLYLHSMCWGDGTRRGQRLPSSTSCCSVLSLVFHSHLPERVKTGHYFSYLWYLGRGGGWQRRVISTLDDRWFPCQNNRDIVEPGARWKKRSGSTYRQLVFVFVFWAWTGEVGAESAWQHHLFSFLGGNKMVPS